MCLRAFAKVIYIWQLPTVLDNYESIPLGNSDHCHGCIKGFRNDVCLCTDRETYTRDVTLRTANT